MFSRPGSAQARICLHTLEITHSPMLAINPDSSASGMKRSGTIMPSVG